MKNTLSGKMSKTLEQTGKLASPNENQYILRESGASPGSLPYSAKLLAAGAEWDLQSDSSMLIAGDWYGAKVKIPRIEELEQAKNLKTARNILLENLTVESVVMDKQMEQLPEAERNLRMHIRLLENGTSREDLAGVRQCAERYMYHITRDCAWRVGEDPNISAPLKSAIRDFSDKYHPIQRRISLMRDKEGFNYDSVPMISFLCEAIGRGCKAYRKQLLEVCPALLKWHVLTANDRVVLNVTLSDLELFSKLEELMNGTKFAKVLPKITTKYWTAVKGLKKWTPVISSAYFYLLRSLLQAAEDVSSALNGLEVIVYENEWKLRTLPEEQSSQVRICVEQLKLLVDLTNHYEPGKSTVTEKFPYEVKQLPSIESTNKLYCLLQETVKVSKTVQIDVEGLFAMLRKFPMNEFQDATDKAVRFILALLPTMVNLVEKDAVILQKQLNSSYSSLLDAFTTYWRQRHAFYINLVSRLPGNYWQSKAPEVMETFLQIMMNLMGGMAPPHSGQFLRVLDGILTILSELRFDWYVSRVPDDVFVTNGLVSSCNSESTDGTRWHLVLQPDTFVEQYRQRFPDLALPKHYEVLRLKSLLSTVQTLTGQRTLTKKRILDSTVLLVTTIRKVLFNLHRADCGVKKLYSISTEPLQSTVEDFVANPKSTFDDFRIELQRLGESYLCIPVIPENPSDAKGSHDRLRNYYAAEIEKYAREEEVDVARPGSGFVGVLDWTLPILTRELACIPTVWSRLASKGWVSLCKYPSPTAGQFCSVLKLVNFGTHEGSKVPIHLVGLLPDQEKALVMGLSSAVLAYRGYQVYIAYPNRYLLEKQATKFRELFGTLNLRTYDELMLHCYKPLLTKAESYLRRCMDLESNAIADRTGIDLDSSVLLMDEVDAYFSEKFINFPMNVQVMIPGLDLVQREIWSIVTSGDSKKESITHKIDSFVLRNDKQKFHALRDFLGKQANYVAYECFSGQTYVTNEELYHSHIDYMIRAAIFVYSVLPAELFQINSSGLITLPNENELTDYHTSLYIKTFGYFKLKQSNFIRKVSAGYNYGYLCIPVGTLSYGYLLSNFKLVLGVTGAVIDSSDQQQISLKNLYSVEAKFPTISADFGQSAEIKFEPGQNFTCSPTESAWRKDIFIRLQATIDQDRSAIVFFNADNHVQEFRQEYGSQLERLNILTAATDMETMERCLTDAGLARMTTLATRDMARGMDYRPSVTVVENGGIHVIQCFFSLDSREEVQIQKRTARKPNRGTYELVVCVDHLKELTLIGDDVTAADGITYDQLNEGRERLKERMRASRIYQMEEANRKHNETVEFYRNH